MPTSGAVLSGSGGLASARGAARDVRPHGERVLSKGARGRAEPVPLGGRVCRSLGEPPAGCPIPPACASPSGPSAPCKVPGVGQEGLGAWAPGVASASGGPTPLVSCPSRRGVGCLLPWSRGGRGLQRRRWHYRRVEGGRVAKTGRRACRAGRGEGMHGRSVACAEWIRSVRSSRRAVNCHGAWGALGQSHRHGQNGRRLASWPALLAWGRG